MFDDLDKQMIDYLAPLFDGAVVSTEVPTPRPDRLIRVMRTGNRRLSVAHRSVQYTVECWSTLGETDAERLADRVEAVLSDWEMVPTGEDGWVSGPVPQRDPDTGCDRYIMTCAVIQFTND